MDSHPRLQLLILSILLVSTLTIEAQKLDGFEFFEESTLINARLASDFKFLQKNKMTGNYQPATFTMYADGRDSIVLDVKIQPRGEFRRKTCAFAPLRIKFDRDEIENSTVKKYNKLKLVTHCKPGKNASEKVVEEFLIYRAYEYLTPYSFRSRLMEIEYIDTGNKKDPGTYLAFLTEDIDQVAARNDAVELNDVKLHPEHADREISTIMPMAMYMIGFTDWSVLTLHNMKLIKLNNSVRRPIPVPYDFDYSGLIDPSYAVPPEFLGITDVTQRVYRGFCRLDGEWDAARQLFLDNEANILNLWRTDPYLTDKTKKKDIKYLEEFFDIIKDDKKFNRTIKETCRDGLNEVVGGINH